MVYIKEERGGVAIRLISGLGFKLGFKCLQRQIPNMLFTTSGRWQAPKAVLLNSL